MISEQFKRLQAEFSATMDELRATADSHEKYELLVKLSYILKRADALIQEAQRDVQDRIDRIKSMTL
jgi:hypothetical protein